MTSDRRNYLRQRRQQPQTLREHLCQLLGRRHLSLLFLVVASTTTLLWVSSAHVYANTDQRLFARTEPIPRLELSSMGGGGSNGRATSRTPFKVRLTGFLHARTKQRAILGLVTFDISSLNKSYLFALAALEAVDQPRISPRKILRTIRRYENNFDVVGPSRLLSRIANADPGTCITLTGFLTLRTRRLQIIAVETQPHGAQNELSTRLPRDQHSLHSSPLNNNGVIPRYVRPCKQSRQNVQPETSHFDIFLAGEGLWTSDCHTRIARGRVIRASRPRRSNRPSPVEITPTNNVGPVLATS